MLSTTETQYRGAYHPSTPEVKFKLVLTYILSLRSAWTIVISKTKQNNKNMAHRKYAVSGVWL